LSLAVVVAAAASGVAAVLVATGQALFRYPLAWLPSQLGLLALLLHPQT
jgi:hypothetical protein